MLKQAIDLGANPTDVSDVTNEPVKELDFVSLWGEDNKATPEDGIQGILGDCWLISVVAAIAERSVRLQEIFKNTELTETGVYGFNFYLQGMPISLTIDDYLPYYTGDDQYTLYGQKGADGSFWGPLLEKAVAKYIGSYDLISGGLEYEAFQMLIGAPWNYHQLSKLNVDEIWDLLVIADARDSMITAATFEGTGNDALGLHFSHAFTVLGSKKVKSSVTGAEVKLIKMRNPWNKEFFKGEWSDKSLKWTADLLDQADHEKDDDGVYYIELFDFATHFEAMTIAEDV